MAKKSRKFTVCDGELVLELQPAGKGWYAVTSPMEPNLHTQAKTIEDAFDMAREAIQELRQVRRKLAARRQRANAAA